MNIPNDSVPIEKKLNELMELPNGWDGYHGQPVSSQVAGFAAQMLNEILHKDTPVPSLVPGSDGSLQIEWHINSYDLEIDILNPTEVMATRYNSKNDKEEIITISTDFSEITNWVDSLTSKSESAEI